MEEQSNKNFIKALLAVTLIVACCNFILPKREIVNDGFLGNNSVSASDLIDGSGMASEVTNQFIPEDLDYSEIIKKIKEEEGIVDENIPKMSLEDELAIMDDETDDYIIKAENAINSISRTNDEIEIRNLLKRAISYYKKQLKINEEDIEALIGIGKCYTFLKDRANARNYLMKALALYSDNPVVQKTLGDFSFEFSEYNNALDYYKLSLLLGNLEDYDTNFITALTYEKLGDIKNAIKYFEISSYINPEEELPKLKIQELISSQNNQNIYDDKNNTKMITQPVMSEEEELEYLMQESLKIK